MERALELAAEAARADEVPIGAVIVSSDGIEIGAGRNTREHGDDPLGHAELTALAAAARTVGDWRIEDATLYVTLEPCPMCLAACQQARIARVVYGAQDPKGGAISLDYKLNEDKRLNHRFPADYHPDLRCETLLKSFFRAKRLKTKKAKGN
jgi:tRNA(adenine34) deaminase